MGSKVSSKGSSNEPRLVKVVFEGGETPDGMPLIETVWAEELGRSRYRLENFPMFTYGISYGDVFEAKRSRRHHDRLCLKRVLEKSGNRTVWVAFEECLETSERTRAVMAHVQSLGCQYAGAAARSFSVNVPPECSLEELLAYLDSNDVTRECADPPPEETHVDGQPAS